VARVRVELPSLLRRFVGDARELELEAETLAGALAELVRLHPALELHLFDESGVFRQHVLCFHNGTNTRWLETLERPLVDGDALTFLQAVSGG
jgi:molybdopterin converting factor small subunit